MWTLDFFLGCALISVCGRHRVYEWLVFPGFLCLREWRMTCKSCPFSSRGWYRLSLHCLGKESAFLNTNTGTTHPPLNHMPCLPSSPTLWLGTLTRCHYSCHYSLLLMWGFLAPFSLHYSCYLQLSASFCLWRAPDQGFIARGICDGIILLWTCDYTCNLP